MRFNFRFLIVLFLFYACSATKVHDNYWLGLKERELNQPTLIRTDGVYVTKVDVRNSDITFYHYLRFYKNGRCFYSNSFDNLPGQDTLKLSHKDIGHQTFFKNKGNNVKIEIWGSPDIGYIYEYGIAEENSLFFDKYKPRFFIFKTKNDPILQYTYYFIPIEVSDSATW